MVADLVRQWQAFMILLDIVHWLPTELQRLDVDDVKVRCGWAE